MRVPSIHNADALKKYGDDTYVTVKGKDGFMKKGWVLARPEPFGGFMSRFKLAWMVFTGKADALTWTGQDDSN